ncbi:MAG: YhjD/YihY/BrkB family envelope integrity protein [Polyangiaceae bacterium]
MFSFVTGVSWIAALAGYPPELVAAFESSSLGSATRVVLGGAVWIAALHGLFWVATPRRERPLRPIAPGAVLAAGIQVGVASGARFYLGEIAQTGAFVTALASVALTIAALYSSAASIFLGAEVNRQLGERWRRDLRARLRLERMRRRAPATQASPIAPLDVGPDLGASRSLAG